MLGGVAALISRLGMRREVALYCELNAPLMSRRGSGGEGEGESRLEMGAPSAIRTATERFGPPAARSTAGTTPVRMSVRLRISKIR